MAELNQNRIREKLVLEETLKRAKNKLEFTVSDFNTKCANLWASTNDCLSDYNEVVKKVNEFIKQTENELKEETWEEWMEDWVTSIKEVDEDIDYQDIVLPELDIDDFIDLPIKDD
jgi:phage terminase large subunit-like protein